jgi:hypothetical protein
MKLHVASLVLLSGLAAPTPAQDRATSCARVEVWPAMKSVPRSAPAALSRVPRFSATKVLDLAFTVLFRSGTSALVELRVFTPDDHLYRSLTVPVAIRGRTSPTRSVTGYPRSVPVQPLVRVTRGGSAYAAASTAFPVGGTDIVSSGLYGRWRVEAYIDGAEQRCAAPASFVIGP